MSTHRVRNTVLVGTLAVLALVAAAWFLVLSPRLATADGLATQAEQLSMSNTQQLNRYNQTLDQAVRATQAANEAQALFSTMPEAAELPTVLTQITDAATDAGIALTDISMISTTMPADPYRRPCGTPTERRCRSASATSSWLRWT